MQHRHLAPHAAETFFLQMADLSAEPRDPAHIFKLKYLSDYSELSKTLPDLEFSDKF